MEPDAIGPLIGKGGANIRMLREKSGVLDIRVSAPKPKAKAAPEGHARRHLVPARMPLLSQNRHPPTKGSESPCLSFGCPGLLAGASGQEWHARGYQL